MQGGKVIKKTSVIVSITVLVMLLIPLLMYLFLRSPSVQTYLASKATSYLSRELDAKVSVGGVNISFPVNIVMEDVHISDKKDNPLMAAGKVVLDVNRFSRSRKFLLINKIQFVKTSLHLFRYDGEYQYNFHFLMDYFSDTEKTNGLRPDRWNVIVRSFEFIDAKLTHSDENQEPTKYGFDTNHFALSELAIEVTDILIEKDTLQATINRLSVNESGGFKIKNISGDIYSHSNHTSLLGIKVNTNESNFEFDISLNYEAYESFTDIFNEVEIDIGIHPSTLDLYEAGYFLPTLYGINGLVDFSGELKGFLSNLTGNNIQIQYGDYSRFEGSFDMIGLPLSDETFFNFSVTQASTHKTDIESFSLPLTTDIQKIELPEFAKSFGSTSFTGKLTGFFHDFVAFGTFHSAIGSLNTDMAIIRGRQNQELAYKGRLSTNRFNLKKLLDNHEDFGNIALSASLEGSGNTLDDLDMSVNGEIQTISYKGYNYDQIALSGLFTNRRFNGQILIDDPNLYLDFGGIVDFAEETPLLDFTAQIKDANLSNLNIYQRDSMFQSVVSTAIRVNGRGSNLGNIEGEVNAYSTSYREIPMDTSDTIPGHWISTDVIALESNSKESGKDLRFYSDFLDFQIKGEIYFETMANVAYNYLNKYIPARFPNYRNTHGNNTNQKADFSIHLKNTSSITEVFFPEISIARHSFINGHINTDLSQLHIHGDLEYIALSGQRFSNPGITVSSDVQGLEIQVSSDRFFITDSIWMENFFASSVFVQDTVYFLTQWENKSRDTKNTGSIKAQGQFMSPQKTFLTIEPSYAFINDSLWTFNPDNSIVFDSSHVEINNFRFFKNNEYLFANGTLSSNPQDELEIHLNNFDIESLMFLLGERKITFSGIASGELILSTMNTTPSILTELTIRDFAFNHDHLGDLSLNSDWDASAKAFKIDADVIYYGNVGHNKPIMISGYFYPERNMDNFDLDITIENLKMSVFSRYVEGFASNFRGLASGKLRLDGPTATPELTGKARLVRTGFRVDYLNTPYSFAHEVDIGKDYFRFDNLILNDTIGNSARVNGIIRHSNFFDFNVDVSFFPERMVVLNTLPHQNDLFFGKAFATGRVHVHGNVDDISIDVTATTNRGTQFFLPLDYYGELSESNFISFVSPNGDGNVPELRFPEPGTLGLTLNFDVHITPEAEIQIIFDSQIGDILRGRGFGDLKVEIDDQGSFNMYGDYMIQEGDYLFTLQNLINKRFRMEHGGTIRWTGDPYDADIDIKALYRLRTSLFDLAANQADTAGLFRRRVPVETVLHLRDKLFNPSISFDIQLPGSDETTREMIERIITTEQEMNRQVFSLLILNRFAPPEDGFNTALSYGMGSTSSELLSNQLSNWLSQISSDFDIGINYRPGDEISSQELEVALSTQLFDDRVIIDGNVGVAGDHPSYTNRTSNIIGDVNVEVKITPEGRFRIKAFNRSNTFDVINTNAAYTQGVGIFFRREFDSLADLLRRQRRSVFEIPEIEDLESTIIE